MDVLTLSAFRWHTDPVRSLSNKPGDELTPSGSPTVRRRRLAAELRRLRGNRRGGEVSRGIGWSPTKISRAESGRESLPPSEIEKLIDYYGVTDPLRWRLLELAEGAVQRGWWDDYADAINPQYLEYIGLEEEATSCLQWQSDTVPGLLQTEDYAGRLIDTYATVNPTVTPRARERSLRVRMLRQARLTQEPVLQLSIIMDEAVLLRGIGDPAIMRAQLARLADVSKLPNVDLRVLPLSRNAGLHGASFVIMSFGSRETPEAAALGDVVSTENLKTELYIEGETDTYLYRLFFQALDNAALPPDESRLFIISTLEHTWSLLSTKLSPASVLSTSLDTCRPSRCPNCALDHGESWFPCRQEAGVNVEDR
ncbi:MAG: helix-turn-helix domain protein [Actinomycetia bacterium]|jgi:hypothetical protein|nr:helix-turn-helix domain protein [Actinomycetes bacterium]